MINNKTYIYGGVVDRTKNVYVQRDADEELFESIKKGELCYVFKARKAGKSCLIDNVSELLTANENICITVDLSALSTIEEDAWYCTVLDVIKNKLEELSRNYENCNLKAVHVGTWWEQNKNFAPTWKYNLFLQNYILPSFQQPIIIFIDEVDFVKSLPFSVDPFFTWIRSVYQERNKIQENNMYKRLNFCLLGVAKVSDLITNGDLTSFNIGKDIELTEFQLDEKEEVPEPLRVLINSELIAKVEDPQSVLKRVLKKTGGQPFLTIKLLYIIVKKTEQRITRLSEKAQIQHLVENYITNEWRQKDDPEYFLHIEKRVMRYKVTGNETTAGLTDETKTAHLLNLYRRILEGEEITWNRSNDQLDLQLSGLVSNKNGILKPISPIHEEIFNLAWINKCLKSIRPLWYQEKKTAWETSHIDPSKRDKFYLLYGDELKDAEQKYKRLSLEDEAFINKSNDYFNQDKGGLIHSRFAIEQQKEVIINRMRYWTNYDKEIFDQLMSILADKDIPNLSIDEEDDWFDNLIQEYIIIKWHNIDILSKIDKAIQDQEENKRFDLLVTYGKILKEKIVFAENNQEQKFLLDTGLVKKRYSKDGYYIEVSNPIYWFIFDEDYINEMLPNTRGYGRKLGMWLITQDAQYLLSVEEFNNIIESLADQNLSEDEHRFLIESQLNSI